MVEQRESVPDYFRRDQEDGISPPDLSKDCTFAEHIVRARGKRTRFTSVSLDANRIRDFGPALYRVRRPELAADQHHLVEHRALIDALRAAVKNGEKAARAQAVQALRYAMMRVEGVIDWRLDAAGIERKDLLAWAAKRVRPYFAKV